MSGDELRTAALLFSRELAAGQIDRSALEGPEVRAAVRARRVPPLPVRVADRLRLGRGLAEAAMARALEARRAVLGGGAAGPPRILLRVDEFPNVDAYDAGEGMLATDSFARFHEILAGASCAYMLAVLPRVPLASQDPAGRVERPHDGSEREMLARLRSEGVELAVHGHDHRTRDARPRHHSELIGLGPEALADKLDASEAVLAELGIPVRSFVPPFNRFSADQFPQLAARYEIVCAGPETVMQMGFQATPQWRAGTAYVPSYAPFYGRSGEIGPAVERLIDREACLWVPVVLHWSWEVADDDYAELARLAELLGPLTASWQELLDATEPDATDRARPPAGAASRRCSGET